MKPHFKKYFWGKTIGIIAYVFGMVAMYHFNWEHPDSPYRFWLVLLPALPIVYLTVIAHRHFTERDEMWRKIITESLAFSAVATAWTCVSYVFLRHMGAPEFRAEWALFILAAYYLIGNFFIRRRYK